MRFLYFTKALPALVLCATAGVAFGAIETSKDFEVFPKDINLKYLRDKQSVVVKFTEPSGVCRDVTLAATLSIADPAKAKIDKAVVLPVADGETTLKVEWQGHSAEVPVKVEQATTEQATSFRL